MSKKITIVVSKYRENIDWIEQLKDKFNVIVYNKDEGGDLPNVGREGHTIYTHIVNNYDNLDDHIVFLQGHPFDHSPNIINDLSYLKHAINTGKKVDFRILSRDIYIFALNHGIFTETLANDTYKAIFENIEKEYFPEDKEFLFGAGAQFVVSKKAILKRPIELYKNIIKVLEHNSDPQEGHAIERFHAIIFNPEYGSHPNHPDIY